MKNLAIILSRLETFDSPKVHLEQYPTESQIAYEILKFAQLNSDIPEHVIMDLGCGTGILGIGCLILGAKRVYFIDIDKDALAAAQRNLKHIEELYETSFEDRAVFIHKDASSLITPEFTDVDMVIQNPPFGTKTKNIDTIFLKKAMQLSHIVYTFHKFETKEHIEKIIKDQGFSVTQLWRFDFPLKNKMRFHTKRIEYINVGCWRIEKARKAI